MCSSTGESSHLGHQLGTAMVDIFVGPLKVHFHVHKKLLCAQVPYFQKMFESGFQEASEQSANLPEDDVGAFALFLEWLYGGGKFADLDDSMSFVDDTGLIINEPLMDRIRLYSFAEKIVLYSLMDYTATSIICGFERMRHPNLSEVVLLYQCTSNNAPLRAFMAHHVHRKIRKPKNALMTKDDSTGNISRKMLENEDLMHDVMKLGRGYSEPVDLQSLPKCTFHIHAKDEVCPFKEDMAV